MGKGGCLCACSMCLCQMLVHIYASVICLNIYVLCQMFVHLCMCKKLLHIGLFKMLAHIYFCIKIVLLMNRIGESANKRGTSRI